MTTFCAALQTLNLHQTSAIKCKRLYPVTLFHLRPLAKHRSEQTSLADNGGRGLYLHRECGHHRGVGRG
jgi:hypothetical protein